VRYSWEKRRHYYAEKVGIAFDVLIGRLNCLRGKHWMKFGTAPYCARCGERVVR